MFTIKTDIICKLFDSIVGNENGIHSGYVNAFFYAKRIFATSSTA